MRAATILGRILIRRGRQVHTLFAFLPGQINQIPLISQGLGCIEVPNG